PVAVLLNGSCAVTVKLNPLPAVALLGALTAKCVAAAALTAMLLLVPVMLLAFVSVAVTVWLPAVRRVAENDPVPLLRVEFAGSTALASVLVQRRSSVLPVAVLLNGSCAVTVRLNPVPAVAALGALTTKCVAAAADTAIELLVPVMLLL